MTNLIFTCPFSKRHYVKGLVKLYGGGKYLSIRLSKPRDTCKLYFATMNDRYIETLILHAALVYIRKAEII